MKKTANRNSFRNILREFNEVKKQLSEDYFGVDDEMPMGDDMQMGDEMQMGGDEDGMGQQQISQNINMSQGSDDNKEAEIAMHAQDIIKKEPIISKIRETAIEGIKKYSDNPIGDIYLYFKDVLLKSDKLLTGTGGK